MKTKIIVFIFILILSVPSAFAKESSDVEDHNNVYKNVIDINPTSDGFYVGYERVLLFSKYAFLVFDVKNTSESGDDFGRSGFTFRYGPSPKTVISSRLETAWIDGHHNIAFKLGYDSPFLGCSLTGVKSLSDSETLQSEDTTLSSSSTSTDTKTGSSGAYDNYRKDITTTNEVSVKETKYATPDGILLDLNFNFFKQLNLTIGGSYWTVDDWSETGVHGSLSWDITKGDSIGAHVANIDGNTEGGIFYRKKFNSLGDIFTKGAPFSKSEQPALFTRLASTAYSTPPIKIMTSSEYVETHEEVKIEKTTETYQQRKPLPEITQFNVTDGAGTIEANYEIDGTDPDGNIVSWTITSSGGVFHKSGTQLPASGSMNGQSGTYTFTLTITDNDGNQDSATTTATIN